MTRGGDRRTFVRTVLGDIDPRDLGVTYAHEHLVIDDGSFRWGEAENGTLQLLEWIPEDGLLDRVVLGMDAARRGYYAVYGGAPGLTWLLDRFTAAMEERGLGADARRQLFVEDPARVFAFASID